MLTSGCQWRLVPHDYPKWLTVYFYYKQWAEPDDEELTVLDKTLKKLVAKHRVRDERTKTMSFCILDAQSVKNSATSQTKGYDAAKKISGIKRPIAVDTVGLPHGYLVTPDDISDKSGAIELLNWPDFPRVKSLLCDGGYLGKPFQEKILTAIGATVQVVKRSELHTFKVPSSAMGG